MLDKKEALRLIDATKFKSQKSTNTYAFAHIQFENATTVIYPDSKIPGLSGKVKYLMIFCISRV